MRPFYYLFITLYPVAARVLSLFNKKAKLWVRGRKDVMEDVYHYFKSNTAPVIWFHCASLGEFEQGRPVLEGLKTMYQRHKILVTFFSPSGYEIRKNYKLADFICYLPMDSPLHAKRFVTTVRPSLVVFVKYEFWFYYLKAIRKRDIPLLLVSGLFRENQIFFKKYGGFYRRMLRYFTYLFVQTPKALQLLQSIGIANAGVSGDTRFDRVLATAQNFEPVPLIEAFCAGKKTIVAGSTWTEDDEELDHFVIHHPDMRFIIAPHDISEERLKECERLYKHTVRYSHLGKAHNTAGINTLLIDNIGMLSRLYKYATICYVGGAFGGDGIHNILEPAVFAKPVLFGPVHDKFPEAGELIEAGGAYSIENALELEKVLDELLSNEEQYAQSCAASLHYVQGNAGATGKVIQYIQEKRLLTS
ncbi:3-deoxy-D-manno-octulosonic acid transferase [Ilyomonas limi]|uniref:3-deoxy-D-manno-octulosonic acid transferase n=1 Tax=Ilyomonas limi TaxID=2575867 RepID=A0A4U3KZ70_9BACT|nr:glycosyltransferase N-terminal domain-containing protein [Ilyomonas limi]TKK67189.1 3-deoxy-D-manno-octulosonic acid transferase [Ilyomonas limi]